MFESPDGKCYESGPKNLRTNALKFAPRKSRLVGFPTMTPKAGPEKRKIPAQLQLEIGKSLPPKIQQPRSHGGRSG